MGRHGTILDWDGEGSPSMAAVPSSPSLSPSSFSPSVLVSSDRVRHRKTPSIRPPRSYSLLGPDREDIEGLTKTMTGEGRVGRVGGRCQLSGVTLSSEASWPNITGAWQRQRWGREVGKVHKEGENTQKGTVWCGFRETIMDRGEDREERLAASPSTNLYICRRWTQHYEPQWNLMQSNTKAFEDSGFVRRVITLKLLVLWPQILLMLTYCQSPTSNEALQTV